MQLSESGESRVRGYLYVLERSLSTFLPAADALDASREVESHIRERLDETEALPDERTAIERVLGELGPPLRVARAYSLEMSATEAVATGRVLAVGRALWHMAALGVGWFFSTLALFTGYAFGASFLAIAILKPIFPNNVGLFIIDGVPRSFGATTNLPAGTVVAGGYWIIPICLVLGSAILIGTHIAARRLLESWLSGHRERRAFAR
jgi:hypothetical protein